MAFGGSVRPLHCLVPSRHAEAGSQCDEPDSLQGSKTGSEVAQAGNLVCVLKEIKDPDALT